MELHLTRDDLNSDSQNVSCSLARFEHFKPEAQNAIVLATHGTFYDMKGSQNESYNRVYPPENAATLLSDTGYIEDAICALVANMQFWRELASQTSTDSAQRIYASRASSNEKLSDLLRLRLPKTSRLSAPVDCYCAAYIADTSITYPAEWKCPYHGRRQAGAMSVAICAEQERQGILKQKDRPK